MSAVWRVLGIESILLGIVLGIESIPKSWYRPGTTSKPGVIDRPRKQVPSAGFSPPLGPLEWAASQGFS